MSECTTETCSEPTDLYLCGQCVSDLQQWIDKVIPTRQMLFTTMAKLDNTGPKNSEGGGGGSTGSAMPLREGAMDLRYALAIWEGRKAADLAHEEYAGGYVGELKRLIEGAEKIVDLPSETVAHGPCGLAGCPAQLSGPPEAGTVTCKTCGTVHNVKERRAHLMEKAHGEPKTPKEAREYVRKETGLDVAKKEFENWVHHGHLQYVLERVTTEEKPRRFYRPGDVFKTAQKMRDRRVKL